MFQLTSEPAVFRDNTTPAETEYFASGLQKMTTMLFHENASSPPTEYFSSNNEKVTEVPVPKKGTIPEPELILVPGEPEFPSNDYHTGRGRGNLTPGWRHNQQTEWLSKWKDVIDLVEEEEEEEEIMVLDHLQNGKKTVTPLNRWSNLGGNGVEERTRGREGGTKKALEEVVLLSDDESTLSAVQDCYDGADVTVGEERHEDNEWEDEDVVILDPQEEMQEETVIEEPSEETQMEEPSEETQMEEPTEETQMEEPSEETEMEETQMEEPSEETEMEETQMEEPPEESQMEEMQELSLEELQIEETKEEPPDETQLEETQLEETQLEEIQLEEAPEETQLEEAPEETQVEETQVPSPSLQEPTALGSACTSTEALFRKIASLVALCMEDKLNANVIYKSLGLR